AQLTQRTNQFNLSTIRRKEREIEELLNTRELEGKSIRVKDRFGNYGLVGILLYRTQSTKLIVDTLLLSCRVLGRGVEYEMVKYLGQVAQEKNLSPIEIPYYPTAKNQPVKDFLEKIAKKQSQPTEKGELFEFASEELVNLSFTAKEPEASRTQKSPNLVEKTSFVAPCELLREIGTKLRNPEEIWHDIAERQQNIRSEKIGEYVPPRNQLEEQLALIWQEVLKVDRVGIYDNFFELGGNSLLATQVISRIRESFQLEVSVQALFSWSTLTELAEYINNLTWTFKQTQSETETNNEDYEEGEL
ncbi:phosphopantetheine-binding protein, partial [Crocosphaera chwakensis]